MFADFGHARDVHEMLWYLTEALAIPQAAAVHDEIAGLADELAAVTVDLEALRAVDTSRLPSVVGPLLDRALALARPAGPQLRRASLDGRRLSDLREADLRG